MQNAIEFLTEYILLYDDICLNRFGMGCSRALHTCTHACRQTRMFYVKFHGIMVMLDILRDRDIPVRLII